MRTGLTGLVRLYASLSLRHRPGSTSGMEACEQVARQLEAQKLDGLLITGQANIRYVSRFTGPGVCVLLSPNARILITDARYVEQAEDECNGFEIVGQGPPHSPLENVVDAVKAAVGRLSMRRLGFEERHITYELYRKLFEALQGTELVPMAGIVENLRYVKDEQEMELIARAARITDEAFQHILGVVKIGVEERDIEAELDYFMKRNGPMGSSFTAVVASGPRSSLSHAMPTRRKIEYGDFVIVKFGAVYSGYRSDMTRTVVVGRANDTQKQVYGIVKRAWEEGLRAIRAGVHGAEPDRCARNVVTEAGFGEFFGHGLGHGIGLDTHEEPFMSARCKRVLAAGNVITVEPGVYLPKWGGVRIGDTVKVSDHGCECMTLSSNDLITL